MSDPGHPTAYEPSPVSHSTHAWISSGEERLMIDSLEHPPAFSLQAQLLHVFISYRKFTDTETAAELYRYLLQASSFEQPIPPGALGLWPNFISAPAVEHDRSAKCFLDSKCLPDGKPWQSAFASALVHSMIFVPLLSWTVDANSKDCGSVGGMMALHHKDQVDNVLLEIILAIEWFSRPNTSLRAILPVFVGERKEDGHFGRFPMSRLKDLPDKPSVSTAQRAYRILQNLGVEESQLDKMKHRSVKGSIHILATFQGIRLHELDEEPLGKCSTRVLSSLLNEIRVVQMEPPNLRFSKPHGEEVMEWLMHQSLMPLADALSYHGLHSLHLIAALDKERIAAICAYNRTSQQRSMGLEIRLQNAVAQLKDQKVAQSMKGRLLRFADGEVAMMSAFWSTNSVEVFAFKFKSVIAIAAVVSLALNVFFVMDPTKTVSGQQFESELWSTYTLKIGSMYLSFSLAYGAYLAFQDWVYDSKRWLEGNVLIGGVFVLFASGVADIVQIETGNHDPGWTTKATMTDLNGALLYLIISLALANIAVVMQVKPEFTVLSILSQFGVLCIVMGANSWKEQLVRGILNILIGVILCGAFAFTAIVNRKTWQLAKQRVSEDRKSYDDEWLMLKKADPANSCAVSTNSPSPSESAPVNGRSVLQGLTDLTRKINDQIETQIKFEKKKIGRLSLLFSDPANLPGRISLSGKIRQRTNDLDELFGNAAMIVDAVQDMLMSFLQELSASVYSGSSIITNQHRSYTLLRGPAKQPRRAIQKCVRTYRRDVASLTDLVRCCVLVGSIKELFELVEKLAARSVVGLEDVTNGGDTQRMFRITGMKNRFDDSSGSFDRISGYRDLSVNLEVGWIFVNGVPYFIPISEWQKKGAQTHIIEVQIHLRSLFFISHDEKGGHKGYEDYRNLLGK